MANLAVRLGRDIEVGDLLVDVKGNVYAAHAGNGMKKDGMGHSVFGYYVDRISGLTGDELTRLEGPGILDLEATNKLHSEFLNTASDMPITERYYLAIGAWGMDGRIGRAQMGQPKSETGRMSCTEPNMKEMPRETYTEADFVKDVAASSEILNARQAEAYNKQTLKNIREALNEDMFEVQKASSYSPSYELENGPYDDDRWEMVCEGPLVVCLLDLIARINGDQVDGESEWYRLIDTTKREVMH